MDVLKCFSFGDRLYWIYKGVNIETKIIDYVIYDDDDQLQMRTSICLYNDMQCDEPNMVFSYYQFDEQISSILENHFCMLKSNEFNWQKLKFHLADNIDLLKYNVNEPYAMPGKNIYRYFSGMPDLSHRIVLLVAVDQNSLMQDDDNLIFTFPEHQRLVMSRITDNRILFGKNTLEKQREILYKYDASKIVLTRKSIRYSSYFRHIHNPEDAVPGTYRYPIYVLGGASIIRSMLPYVTKIIITRIEKAYRGDIYLPDIEWDLFEKKQVRYRTSASGIRYSQESYILKTYVNERPDDSDHPLSWTFEDRLIIALDKDMARRKRESASDKDNVWVHIELTQANLLYSIYEHEEKHKIGVSLLELLSIFHRNMVHVSDVAFGLIKIDVIQMKLYKPKTKTEVDVTFNKSLASIYRFLNRNMENVRLYATDKGKGFINSK